MLKLQAGGERGLGDLELLGTWILGRKPVLELVTRLRERARDARSGFRTIQLNSSVATPTAPSCAAASGRPAQVLRRARGERAADRRTDQQRPDDVRAATLVLLRPGFPVLVAADRDVLGAVVSGDLRASHRQGGRRERQAPGEKLLCERPQPRSA